MTKQNIIPNMQVKCITIEGENSIIAADQFDWLCAQAAKVEKLEKVAEAAAVVVAWDWSNCVDDMKKLEMALDAL